MQRERTPRGNAVCKACGAAIRRDLKSGICRSCAQVCACGREKNHRATLCRSCANRESALAQWAESKPRESTKVALVCPLCGKHFTRFRAEMRKVKTSTSHCSMACYRAALAPFHFPAIYAIVHIATGRAYVGGTTNLQDRWRSHKGELRRGVHVLKQLQEVFDDHGADSLEWRILERVTDVTTLLEREQFWIDTLSAADPTRGFNRAPTAGSIVGMKLTAETRARISAGNRGKVLSQATRLKLSEAKRGKKRPPGANYYRGPLTDEQVHYIRARLMDRASKRAVARELGVSPTTIRAVARGVTYQTVI